MRSRTGLSKGTTQTNECMYIASPYFCSVCRTHQDGEFLLARGERWPFDSRPRRNGRVFDARREARYRRAISRSHVGAVGVYIRIVGVVFRQGTYAIKAKLLRASERVSTSHPPLWNGYTCSRNTVSAFFSPRFSRCKSMQAWWTAKKRHRATHACPLKITGPSSPPLPRTPPQELQ